MENRIKKTMVGLMLFFCIATIQAQQVVSPVGGDSKGSGGSISYTVGQVAYSAILKTEGLVSEGVQQAYEIYVIKSTTDDITLRCSVFPNPTVDNIILKIQYIDIANFRYQLYDLNGRILQDKLIVSNETSISMGALPAAIYVLKVTNKKKEVKVFKIIKN